MTELTISNQQAIHQLLGYRLAKQGTTIQGVVNNIDLNQKEFEQIKEHLPKDLVVELEKCFDAKEVVKESNENRSQELSRKIILDELVEQGHIEKVEDVIFWALEDYSSKGTRGGAVAHSIIERIKSGENALMNPEIVNEVF